MKENKTKYISLYESIREDIKKGRFPKGSKLPSKRVTALKYDVSVITVEHAYELLVEEGYVISKEKSGFFVLYDVDELFYNPKSGAEGILEGILSNEEDTSYFGKTKTKSHDTEFGGDIPFSVSLYAKTARKVMSEAGDYIMQKSSMQGLNVLRQTIASYLYRSKRMDVEADDIIIGAGSEYLYGLIVQTFGREVIYGIESPSYNVIARVYESGGATLDMLELGNDGIKSEELWKTKAGILHISPYRSFPSGVTASASKRREYLAWSHKNNAYIIEDDFESEFTPSRKYQETLFSMDDKAKVIYVNTFTQTIGPAIRAAYMVVPKSLRKLFNDKVGFYACPLPTLEQLILAELINNGDFERHINKVRRHLRVK